MIASSSVRAIQITVHAVVITYPGSNADWDAYFALQHVLKVPTTLRFHTERELGPADLVVVPGGFSYGDYLRPGSIACFSPISTAIQRFAEAGGAVIGICNGFQILTELRLLPGALLRNERGRFECRDVWLRAESPRSAELAKGHLLRLPVAHADGRFTCDETTLAALREDNRIAFRYVDQHGETTAEANVNGSIDSIAGIYNARGNVLGLMPHPERACDAELGSTDGAQVLLGVLRKAIRS